MVNKKIYNKLRLIYGDKLVGLSIDKRYSEISIVKNIDDNTDLLAVLKEEEKLVIINYDGEIVAKHVRYDTWRYSLDSGCVLLLKTDSGNLIEIISDEVIIDTDGNVVFKGLNGLYGKIETSDKSDIDIGKYRIVCKYEIASAQNPAGAHINYTIDFENKKQYAEFINMCHEALDYRGRFEAFRITDIKGNKLLLTGNNEIIPDIEGAMDDIIENYSADVRHIFGERVVDYYRHTLVRKGNSRVLYLNTNCTKNIDIKYNKDMKNVPVSEQGTGVSRITIGKIYRQVGEYKYTVDSVICRDVDVHKDDKYLGNVDMLRFTKDSIESIDTSTMELVYKRLNASRNTFGIKALINGKEYNTMDITVYTVNK